MAIRDSRNVYRLRINYLAKDISIYPRHYYYPNRLMIPGITYLNWAGLAPLTVKSYMHSLFAPELMGNVLLPNWVKRVDKLREDVALWLGCHSEQVAFVPSTSMALTIAAHSLTWQNGDTILYPANDFLANVLPWQSLERFGVEAQAVQDWAQPWVESVKMVSISTVDFTTGIEHSTIL